MVHTLSLFSCKRGFHVQGILLQLITHLSAFTPKVECMYP